MSETGILMVNVPCTTAASMDTCSTLVAILHKCNSKSWKLRGKNHTLTAKIKG